ncbi:hypothetical protein [Arhodomonas sp. AD133]|uniref:hypothetical protein n=1 Tax=Arhodomonas sp. AD133 TaxID=3415009 RepID=UPI003EBC32A5
MTHTLRASSRAVVAILAILLLTAFQQAAAAGEPRLAFSDLISGPSTGLGDGQGSGVIVTVWGQNLGVGTSSREIRFIDSNGNVHQPHVYYWKRADGNLPSGPANLHASHRMQEIAFSVPNALAGPGEIVVSVDGQQSNALPFTVRSGGIYHVKSTGSDSGDGSWSDAWRSVNHAVNTAPAGSTIYIHDVNTGSSSDSRGIYMNNASASSSQDAQFAVAAYPGYQPKVTAQRGLESYKVDAFVVSKLDFRSSNYTSVDANDQPTGSTIHFGGTFAIKTSKHGRAVANRITDIPGGCASRTQGAILGSAKWGTDRVSDYKIFGNEIYEYGCAGSNKLHHTTYISVRSDGRDMQVEPWEFGWNYLHDNDAKFGIHQFDQNADCGDPSGPLRIHHNVVINQGGAGISIGSECWEVDAYIEDNVLINVGLAADWDGVDPDTSKGRENGGIAIRDSGLVGTMYIRNNLIHGYTTDGQTRGGRGCLNLNGSEDNVAIEWSNNICYTEDDLPFVGTGYRAEPKLDNITGSNNVWHYTGSSPTEAIVPGWDNNPIIDDPLVVVNGATVALQKVSQDGAPSPIIDQSTFSSFDYDIYGNRRDVNPDIGPVEYLQESGCYR